MALLQAGFPIATTIAWPSMIRQEFDRSPLTSAGQAISPVITSARMDCDRVRRLPSQLAMLSGCSSIHAHDAVAHGVGLLFGLLEKQYCSICFQNGHLSTWVPIAHFIKI